jgi:hypothetical protein
MGRDTCAATFAPAALMFYIIIKITEQQQVEEATGNHKLIFKDYEFLKNTDN